MTSPNSGLSIPGIADTNCLLDSLRPKLLAFVGRFVHDPWAAEDVTQEVFLRLCAQKELRNPAALRSWLFAVARNTALDHLRRPRREALVDALPDRAEERSPSDIAQGVEVRELVGQAIERLGEPRCTVAKLCLLDGLDHATIGRMIDCPEVTVSTRMFRSRVRLRRSLRRLAS